MEFRLLLSPDRDCESTPVCDPFMLLGLTKLVGRDKRFSRSTSERNGLFGVSYSINFQIIFKESLENGFKIVSIEFVV